MLLQRNDPVDRRIGERYMTVGPLPRCLVQLGIDMLLKLGATADGVLAGDDMKWGCRFIGFPQHQPLGDCTGDMLQHRNPNRRGYQVGFGNCPGGGDRVIHAVDRRHAAHKNGFPLIAGQSDGIFLTPRQFRNQFLVDIDKTNLVTGTGQQQADKPSPDIPCAEMDRLHASIPLREFPRSPLPSLHS